MSDFMYPLPHQFFVFDEVLVWDVFTQTYISIQGYQMFFSRPMGGLLDFDNYSAGSISYEGVMVRGGL